MPRLTRRGFLAVGAAGAALPVGAAAWAERAGDTRRLHRALAAPATDGVTRLQFWGGWTGPDGAAMQGLVRRFNAQSRDVQVTLTLYNWDLIFDRWRSEFDGGTPPDLVGIHATEVAEYAARGMLYDVTDAAGRYGLRASDFYPPPWRLCRVGGGLYAVPLDIHPLGLYINARQARQVGLDPRRPPRTASELLSWAARLTRPRTGTWGYAAPAGDVECFRQWYSLLYQLGGRFMDPAGARCLVDSAAGAAAYAYLSDLVVKRRVAMPREGAVDDDFIAGRVAMYLQGPWYIEGARQAGLELVTAPAPRVGPRRRVWANSHALGVVNTLDPARVDAAMRFISWVNAHALDWAQAGQVPAHNDARARLDATPIGPSLRPFVAALPSIVYQPNLIVHTRLFAERTSTPVISATRAVMLGQETPAAAVRVMSAQVDALVSAPS